VLLGQPVKLKYMVSGPRSLRCPGERIGAEIQAGGLEGSVLQTNEGGKLFVQWCSYDGGLPFTVYLQE